MWWIPGVIDPQAFLREVLTQRLPNPFMPDTPQRIATDTSQKIAGAFWWHAKSGRSGRFAVYCYSSGAGRLASLSLRRR